jgi:membrane-associated phospholipid phosphatase
MADPNAPPPLTLSRVTALVAIGLGLTAASHLLDPLAHETLRVADPDRLDRRDWVRVVRVMGYAPLWLGVAIVLWRADARRFAFGKRPAHLADRYSRAVLLLLSVAVAGLLAEGVKLATRRLRPAETADWPGYTVDWPAAEPWSSAGLGLASSHAAVAFAAALMLARLHPGLRRPLFALAVGCAWQRVAVGAHYLSDVVVAALIAAAVVAALWRVHWIVMRRRFGR